MNELIKPIFEIILPAIESAGIKYWIYGGIGYAAMVGRFYRSEPNSDVDLCVSDNDFIIVENILKKICEEKQWKMCETFLKSGRPKIDLLINRIERLSVVPIYKENEWIEFKFEKKSKKYPVDVLVQTERYLDDLMFFTLQDKYLKDLFILYLDSKQRPYKSKRVEDGRNMLSEDEFKKYFPSEIYKP